ncbi:MAG: hypothetical protein JRF07_00550 [Deltaproteobacteria bacterium]|jgi:phosphopantetheinyl transferase|nr:hypothetical protein [Deltaproteobacteria bacterium]MBW2476440.1 hypothetical protein [Deltaproteobacteria bacterium]
MEDLWYLNSCGVDIDDIADLAEYKKLLERFNIDEERENQRRLLFETSKMKSK